jgi:enoyl-CoA hydratase/carnithine racemase
MEMLLVGGVHDADFAARSGLVNAVVPQNELSPHVMAVAAKIADKSQHAIRYGKRSFYEQRTLPLADAYEMTSGIMVKNMLDDAAFEGLEAFINKRQPLWPELK